MEDNESEKEKNEFKKVINPETTFILYFDFCIIVSYLYIFLVVTFNLANVECLCV